MKPHGNEVLMSFIANKHNCHFERKSETRNLQHMYKTYYVYIMSNTHNTTLYIGVTNDIERRVQEHKSGSISGFTQKYCCDKLVYYEEYSDINEAIEREKKLKKWRREKKDWLIKTMNPDLKDLGDEIVL